MTSENGILGADAFSLQINTNTFNNTPLCQGIDGCQGWRQFVYSNVAAPHMAFMQYWLIGYGPKCPDATWNPSNGSCFKNSPGVSTPAQTITNLANLSVTGLATSGGMDTVIMRIGSTVYSAQGADSVLNLAQSWQQAEFNVFGDSSNSQLATFNSGSTIVVRTAVDNGSPSAPSCVSNSFTFETNNLYFVQTSTVPMSETLPAIVFTEGSAPSVVLPCAQTLGAIGYDPVTKQNYFYTINPQSGVVTFLSYLAPQSKVPLLLLPALCTPFLVPLLVLRKLCTNLISLQEQ